MSVGLQEFKRLFPVRWKSLLAGWRGVGSYSRLVTISDIRQFALEVIVTAPEPDRDTVALATIMDSEADQLEDRLIRLASSEPETYVESEQRWVASLLDEKLRSLPEDPLCGLLELTEFWADLGFPSYSPHFVHGRGNSMNSMDVKEYYTKENFLRVVDANRSWIEKMSRGEKF